MQIKLFGKNLFEINGKKSGIFIGEATNENKKSKYLPDFLNARNNSNSLDGYISISEAGSVVFGKGKKKAAKPKESLHLTPKGVFELKMLNDESFKLNTDGAYIEQQIIDFKEKLDLITNEEYDMRRGVEEISSILIRLENRKKYSSEAEFYEQFPYTNSSRIDDLVKKHDYLKLGKIAQFLADMPKEATDVMKEYNKHTNTLCGKQAVFYIIADKKDFEKSEKRRDPILLAQSPFGHFWQILGAWDKEMLLIEEL